jgi:hypothetical protein
MAEKPGITRVTEGDSETEISNGDSTQKHVIKLSGIGDPERYFLRGKGDDGKVFLVPFGPPANSTGGTWNAPTNLGSPGKYEFYLIDTDDNDEPVGTSFKVTRK